MIWYPTVDDIKSLLKDHDFFVAHNSKFELGWKKRLGYPLQNTIPYCTMIGEYTIAGNRKFDLSLDGCLRRYRIASKHRFGEALVHGGVDPEDVPVSVLEEYCMRDVEATEELFVRQRELVYKLGVDKVVYTRNLLTPVLADIEFNGMLLDKERVEEEFIKTHEELLNVERELNELTGGINPRSPKQMAEFIFDTLGFAEPKDRKGNPIRSATGNRKVGSEVIAGLSPRNKRQREFIRLKKSQGELQARVSKALDKFKACCDETDGTLYFNFNQCITQTGRLSSNGKRYKVQGQNIQRDFKKLCKSREGFDIEERDYAQLEFRIAGQLSGDNQILRDIDEHVDVHTITANAITEAGQATTRQEAKSHTFKPLYGGESGTDAERAYYELFKRKYHELTSEQDKWVNQALKSKKLTVPTGLIFYFPELKVQRSGYVSGSTKVKNYPVQYFATGEIVPIALIFLWSYLKEKSCRSIIINTVHDSIVTETHPDERELLYELGIKALTVDVVDYVKKLYNIDMIIPLEIETKRGSHWGEGKVVK